MRTTLLRTTMRYWWFAVMATPDLACGADAPSSYSEPRSEPRSEPTEQRPVTLAPTTDPAIPASPQAPPPPTPNNIMLVLDASGSMRYRHEGQPKIDIAREALSTLAGTLHDDMLRVGLVAYGHRRKRDCDDVELIAPLASLDREDLERRSGRLSPRGMTPLFAALELAGERLAAADGNKTIILLTDGEDNCPGAPQEVVRRLWSDHRIRVHVVGFDIMKTKAALELRTLALAGAGGYFTAATIEGLHEVSTRVVDAVQTGDIRIDRTVLENVEIVLDHSMTMEATDLIADGRATSRFTMVKEALDPVLESLAADRDNIAYRRVGTSCSEPEPPPAVPFGLNRGPEIQAQLAELRGRGRERRSCTRCSRPLPTSIGRACRATSGDAWSSSPAASTRAAVTRSALSESSPSSSTCRSITSSGSASTLTNRPNSRSSPKDSADDSA